MDPARRVIHPAVIVQPDALNGCYKVTEVERKVAEEGALEHRTMLLRGEHMFEVFVDLENGESPAARRQRGFLPTTNSAGNALTES